MFDSDSSLISFKMNGMNYGNEIILNSGLLHSGFELSNDPDFKYA